MAEEAIRSFNRMESLYHIKCAELKTTKAEAIKEFAERLKENASEIVIGGKYKYKVITTEGIDHLAKEMIGEQQ